LSVSALAPSVIFTVVGTITSLKASVIVVPGRTSEPSVMAAPPAPVTDAMRGTIVVVNVQCAAFT